jgi:hypothetical protein
MKKNYALLPSDGEGSPIPEWISRKTLMKYLDYGATQMASLLNSNELVVSVIGKRKFVNRESFLKFLEKNSKR